LGHIGQGHNIQGTLCSRGATPQELSVRDTSVGDTLTLHHRTRHDKLHSAHRSSVSPRTGSLSDGIMSLSCMGTQLSSSSAFFLYLSFLLRLFSRKLICYRPRKCNKKFAHSLTDYFFLTLKLSYSSSGYYILFHLSFFLCCYFL
jgi:hypothetical protein